MFNQQIALSFLNLLCLFVRLLLFSIVLVSKYGPGLYSFPQVEIFWKNYATNSQTVKSSIALNLMFTHYL